VCVDAQAACGIGSVIVRVWRIVAQCNFQIDFARKKFYFYVL